MVHKPAGPTFLPPSPLRRAILISYSSLQSRLHPQYDLYPSIATVTAMGTDHSAVKRLNPPPIRVCISKSQQYYRQKDCLQLRLIFTLLPPLSLTSSPLLHPSSPVSTDFSINNTPIVWETNFARPTSGSNVAQSHRRTHHPQSPCPVRGNGSEHLHD